MKVFEILNHAEELLWQKSGRFELSQFFIDGTPYVIQIEHRGFMQFPELEKSLTAEVSFFRNDIENPDKAFGTVNQIKKPPVKVYGAVLNGLKDRFSDFDAFYFIAAKKHSLNDMEFQIKGKLYSFMADKIVKSIPGIFYYEFETTSDKEFLLSKIRLSDKTKEETGFRNSLSEALKELKIGNGFY